MAITISLLALLATIYQLYLQRVHNEKSLKPLGQIDLGDRKNQMYVHVRNNGVGPMIIDRITYSCLGKTYTNLGKYLELPPRSYMHITVSDPEKKVILPNAHLMVFEKNFEDQAEDKMEQIRKQLTPINVKVEYRDIYDNRFTVERDLSWFSRHEKTHKPN